MKLANKLAIEMVQFRTLEGTDETVLLRASDGMMNDLKKQSGFIRRELARDENGLWVDTVYWENLSAAQEAAENVMKIASCLTFFGMIDQSSMKMWHLERIQTYD